MSHDNRKGEIKQCIEKSIEAGMYLTDIEGISFSQENVDNPL